jgi:hypothetical protein
MSATNIAYDQRWTKALLATFVHSEMFDASSYASEQGIDIELVDRSKFQPHQMLEPYSSYIVMVHWWKDEDTRLSRWFYLAADFEAVKVEISGVCPVCQHLLNNLPDRRTRAFSYGVRTAYITCPECNTALSGRFANKKVGTASIFWHV